MQRPQASQAGPTFTNILLPWAARPGRVGVQYTDIDFRSRENSRVNSFRISWLMTCGAQWVRAEPGTLTAFSPDTQPHKEPLAPCGMVSLLL